MNDEATRSDRTEGADSPTRRPAPGQKVLRHLRTGVPGLDAVLGGGLPEFSFNMLAGGPGAGKTTLAQQILFANATRERPALYFTVLGEPTVKMLRYQQQFSFFKPELVGNAVHYLNLSEEALAGDLSAVLGRLTSEVERLNPGIVVVDSFRTIQPSAGERASGISAPATFSAVGLEQFVQRLALHLTSWEVTSLLIGEYDEPEQRQPLFTIADGIVWLTQETHRNSVVRKLQAVKVRGQAQMPGLHTFRITTDGLQVFPRIPEQQADRRRTYPASAVRLSSGVPGLDAMLGGGIPVGDAVMVAGATGTGKSTFGMQFAAEGLRQGESVVVAVFEEYPEAYLARLRAHDIDPDALVAAGKLRVSYLRPLDLSVDETLADILSNVKETGATRVVIDSLTGFEIALAPTFREDFRESLYRLVGALTATGVTVFMTLEAVSTSDEVGFTGERVSFITDDIIVQRYVEVEGKLVKVVSIIKMRGSAHSTEFRKYQITDRGATIGDAITDIDGLLTGSPTRRSSAL
ncbi:ATPase domain-containing protein [Gemmatimonas groenlandica]|uniref:non-specific serine/threonine protein kinase n=1 Tax=Gemmatimonas groenlandica TaxID=2732249 RepID=A0A6M4IY88_9BACT|nr:ATPase domain-containing protein [Gemmatimonas groenlandica]QJR37842.1 AAA family ATPase [Gemmatimonas groenlandica]